MNEKITKIRTYSRDFLLCSPVVITRGIYKGRKGKIVGFEGDQVRVLLVDFWKELLFQTKSLAVVNYIHFTKEEHIKFIIDNS